MDRYKSFVDLQAGEEEGVDYAIVAEDRPSQVIVLAPHGGCIEPGTSELATMIAGKEHSLYCFEGLKSSRPHADLHITSERFDEPTGRRMVAAADYAVAVHGRADAGDLATTWLGGLDDGFARHAKLELEAAGFACSAGGAELAGRAFNNICNANRGGGGLQLEIPRGLRDRLRGDLELMERYAGAIRASIVRRSSE